MDILVTDSRFSLTLTNKILEVLLKALLAFQEAHGHVIICFTVIQLWVEQPKKCENLSSKSPFSPTYFSEELGVVNRCFLLSLN